MTDAHKGRTHLSVDKDDVTMTEHMTVGEPVCHVGRWSRGGCHSLTVETTSWPRGLQVDEILLPEGSFLLPDRAVLLLDLGLFASHGLAFASRYVLVLFSLLKTFGIEHISFSSVFGGVSSVFGGVSSFFDGVSSFFGEVNFCFCWGKGLFEVPPGPKP